MLKPFLFLIFLVLPVLTWAEDFSDDIEIFSDELHYFPKEDKAIFQGKVETYQKDMEMKSDRMIVLFEGKKHGSEGEEMTRDSKVQQVNLEGNVVIITPKEKALAKRGEYIVETSIATLFDDVRLLQDGNWLYGEKFVYNRNTGESIMYAGSKNKRVRGHFKSEEKNVNAK